MVSSFAFTAVVLLSVALAALVAVLIWQASVRPHKFEDLFVIPQDGAYPSEGHAGEPRLIGLEGTTNFRDLGGYETLQGQIVKWGMVYRSARLLQLSDRDMERIKSLGIKTVVDFRQSRHVQARPDRLPDGVQYKHMPVYEDTPMSPIRVLFNRHRLLEAFAHVYSHHIVERGGAVFGELIRLLSQPRNLPLLFHCTAGKDRTGVAAFVILRALGVPRKMAVQDYLLTNLAAETFIEQINTMLGSRNVHGVAVEQLYPLLAASPRLINSAADHIDMKYGGIEGYLYEQGGLDGGDLSRLRATLLTE